MSETVLTPTAEQSAIINKACNESCNFIVQALAGSAKTTSIKMIANALPSVEILAVAFNKAIQEDLAASLPPNAQAKTLNSLGFGICKDILGKFPKLVFKKTNFILDEEIKKCGKEEQAELREDFVLLRDAIDYAKQVGFVPDEASARCRSVVSAEEFWEGLDFYPSPFQSALIIRCICTSINQFFNGVCDFGDQIYMPCVVSCNFPRPQLTIVDEAQDLSPLNHVFLRKLVRGRRIIAVGDANQAIYGFRGASANSLSELQEAFDMEQLELTICFRSAQSIIKNVHWKTPQMRWRDGAPDGTVETWETWDFSMIPPDCAIICRNNAPLFNLAVRLFLAGFRPQLVNNDIVTRVGDVIKKLGKPTASVHAGRAALVNFREEQLEKIKNQNYVRDLCACVEVFFTPAETMADVRNNFETLVASRSGIPLMTGHKSKGLEFDNVILLDTFLLSKDGQDPNLRYVMETRARNRLIYARSDAIKDVE